MKFKCRIDWETYRASEWPDLGIKDIVFSARVPLEQADLKGASWVDPQDFSFDPDRTIQNALAQDINEFSRINDGWLNSGILAETAQECVNDRVFKLMLDKTHHSKVRLRI